VGRGDQHNWSGRGTSCHRIEAATAVITRAGVLARRGSDPRSRCQLRTRAKAEFGAEGGSPRSTHLKAWSPLDSPFAATCRFWSRVPWCQSSVYFMRSHQLDEGKRVRFASRTSRKASHFVGASVHSSTLVMKERTALIFVTESVGKVVAFGITRHCTL
jgi:hypothetical protein